MTRLRHMDVDFYHYYIVREDQSVQEQIMIKHIDQFIRVNKLLFTEVDLATVENVHLRRNMLNFFEIITTISSVLGIKAGTPEHPRMKDELCRFIERESPYACRRLRRRLLGRAMRLRSRPGRSAVKPGYRISRRLYGFN